MMPRSVLPSLLLLGSLAVLSGCHPSRSISTAGGEPPSPELDTAPSDTEGSEAIALAPDPDWLQLVPPIDCTIGEDCFTILYVDRNPSEAAQDFQCGRQTYDGHKGTDFAIPDLETMERGVAVVAAADGTVLRVRDGEPDRRLATADEIAAVERTGRECGNGMVIDHGDGWETQYCHLKEDSLVVEPGQPVRQGEPLGLVGLSGKTTFPHVHLSVRYRGEVVDPFVGVTSSAGCRVEPRSIWQTNVEYEPTDIVRAGFAAEDLTMDRLWRGDYDDPSLSRDIPLIYFWVHGYGIWEGDVERFRLLDPRGNVITDFEKEAESSNLTWFNAVGKRNTRERPILPGIWRGEYELRRDGEIIRSLEREIEVR